MRKQAADGGWVLSETTTGLIGEHIVAAVLLDLGWRAVLAQQDKIDLFAFKDEMSIRVQVKSSRLRKKNRTNGPGYQFQCGSGSAKKTLPTVEDYDVLALCAIDRRRCVFYPVESLRQKTKRFMPRYFDDPFIEQESFEKALAILAERKGWKS